MNEMKTAAAGCATFGHDYSKSKTVDGPFGGEKRRVRYCSFCGAERPTRAANEGGKK